MTTNYNAADSALFQMLANNKWREVGLGIILAKHAGFCFGVKRALDLTVEAANTAAATTSESTH